MLGKRLYDSRKRLESTLRNLIGRVVRQIDGLGSSFGYLTTVVWTAIFLLALAICCSGCAPQIRTVRPPLPPQAQAREVPSFQGQTYRDVILYVIQLKEVAQQSEADKAAIRRVYGQP